jgi:xylulokinase
MVFLGIDSGTQSTKTVALDADSGALLASASAAYGLIEGLPPGHLEQEPGHWTEAVERTVAACLEQLGPRKAEVRGIGVSGQQHGLVVLDEADRVIRPAKLWCDTSTAAQCEEIAAAFGGQSALLARTGNAMLPGYTAPKILWLKQHEPEHFARVRSVLLPHDYLNFFLTGVKRMEYGDASGTGLLDLRSREWDAAVLETVDPRLADWLPPLGSSLAPHGILHPERRDRWGLPDGVVVSAGGGDNMMGAIGTGNVTPGTVTASFGTSGTLYACADHPVIDPRGEVAAFCDSTDRWLPLVCTMNVTVTTEAVRSLFGWSHSELENAVAAVEPGAGGLVFLPYLNGERTPNLPAATGVVHGLRSDTLTPGHLARAAMEGVTLGLAYGLRRFTELGVRPSEIRLTGGGSKSAVWRGIAADAFGVPVVTLTTAEGAALGAAIQAAHASGTVPGSMADLCARWVRTDESTRTEPDAGRAAAYAARLDRHLALTSALHGAGFL